MPLLGAFGDRSVFLLQTPKLLKTKDDFLNGQILLIDKPLEWSSFQAVNALKWAIRKKFDLKKYYIGRRVFYRRGGRKDATLLPAVIHTMGRDTCTLSNKYNQLITRNYADVVLHPGYDKR